MDFFSHHQKLFLFKKMIKKALRYLYNVVILFINVFYLKLNFKLKIDLKYIVLKPLKKISKNIWPPWVTVLQKILYGKKFCICLSLDY